MENIKFYHKKVGYYLESFDQWWDVVLGSGFRALADQLSPDDLLSYKAKHKKQIEQHMNEKGMELNVEIICPVGYNPVFK